MIAPNSVAAIANREGVDAQSILADVVAEWQAAGLAVAGVLAERNTDGQCSAGFLTDIASGQRYSIQLDMPPAGTVCHLDAAGMEAAGTGLLAQIEGADLVVLSKFGKLEAMHGGLRPAFAATVAAGKPLLTTVSFKHFDAWKAFAPSALWVEADDGSIQRWWRANSFGELNQPRRLIG